MMKVWVRCIKCGKKIRIMRESLESGRYILSEGTVEVIDDKLYFYCEKHALAKIALIH
ncbi:MAG: hypothetical protein GF329_08260 [Candidatus Lokiarchaeota archaeon]|nr:hypothetical protein [Candidatus Lokiarchaeota archaeon]